MLITCYFVLSIASLFSSSSYQTQTGHFSWLSAFLILVLVLIALYFILAKLRISKEEKIVPAPSPDSASVIAQLTDYFDNLKSELYENELNTFRFIYCLDIFKKKSKRITPKYDLSNFNFSPEERKIAVQFLKNMVEKIIGTKIERRLTPSELMIFLSDYYEFEAREKALKDVIAELQKEGDQKRLKKAEDRLKDIQNKIRELKEVSYLRG